jgi:hypothetical protein
MFSLNYTLQILHIKSSLHSRPYSTEPSTQLSWTAFSVKVKVKVKVMLRPTVSWSVCLGIKHKSGAWDQMFITVWHLQACWCEALSMTRGQVCRLPESHSTVISLFSVCTIYILHVIKCIYNIHKASVSPGSVQQIMPMKSSGHFAP